MNDIYDLDNNSGNLSISQKYSVNDYCRLCASKHNHMIPIYIDEGIHHKLEKKLRTHLPFLNVQQNDLLPQHICYHCASTILVWDKLYESCADADYKLKGMFEVVISNEQLLCKDKQEDFCVANALSSELTKDNFFDCERKNIYTDSPLEDLISLTDVNSNVTDFNNQFEQFKNICYNERVDIDQPEHIDITSLISNNDSIMNSIKNPLNDSNESIKYENKKDSTSLFMNEKQQIQETSCHICKIVFKSRYNLIRHFQKRHPECKTYECDLCLISFSTIDKFKEHLKYMHSSDCVFDVIKNNVEDSKQVRFACDVCGNMYKNKASAMNHLLTHTSNKTVMCQLCNFMCYTKQQLAVHQAKHDKRFICDICNKRFAQKSQLDTHIKAVHYNQRPFSCSLCTKSFKTKGSHDAHMIVHTDTRFHQCPYCDKKCRKRYDLTLHIRTHTGEKPFKCSVCGRGFVQMCDTRKHEMLHYRPDKKKFYPVTVAVVEKTIKDFP
ncbi:zinc finger protein 836-like [Daktulosphaira vitifoliae]|uniref:zinc finger protein 836-like n=1 Tax=Daktulosphaira vitifoliae TaxID=58002 RepID=UPI0021AA0117|nr:zinc finger protein 836-like [Daktulosphaira vitifoliae]